MKIKAHYKGKTRTFYTRKDWHNGKKLYLYQYKPRRLTGNWYTDPNYQTWSWQDYEREYALQESGNRGIDISPEVAIMRNIVERYNDYILELMNIGLVEINLEHIEKSYERHIMLKDIYKIMEKKYGYKVIRDDIINELDIRTFDEVVIDNLSYWEVGNLPKEYINKEKMVEDDCDYVKVGNKYWKNVFFNDGEDKELLKDGYIEKVKK